MYSLDYMMNNDNRTPNEVLGSHYKSSYNLETHLIKTCIRISWRMNRRVGSRQRWRVSTCWRRSIEIAVRRVVGCLTQFAWKLSVNDLLYLIVRVPARVLEPSYTRTSSMLGGEGEDLIQVPFPTYKLSTSFCFRYFREWRDGISDQNYTSRVNRICSSSGRGISGLYLVGYELRNKSALSPLFTTGPCFIKISISIFVQRAQYSKVSAWSQGLFGKGQAFVKDTF